MRRTLLLGSALLAAACGTSSPSVAPSPLGGSVPLRLNTTHEHQAAATVITIVGSTGTAAYLPNPLETAMGSMLAWMNEDTVPHNIVLSNGLVVGRVNPGEMTPSVMMETPTLGYHCTIHPSMTGTISDPALATPAPAPGMPGEPAPAPGEPMPTPTPTPAPPGDYYPYPSPDDGYYDY